jgi:hypothetical protein
MGSGETAPSLVSVHRRLLAELSPPRACWFDTPYGFQENADILSEKTVTFFSQALSTKLHVAHLRHSSQTEVEKQLAYALAQESNYLFSGPGSPSYALAHWKDTELVDLFERKLLEKASVVVFASATACVVGACCLPVYEIYKVGQDPHWLEGLDLLGRLGFRAVVLPHYDNTVGGNHDTRFCYLGERRLAQLEQQLDDDLWIWGVDEHTAVILDLAQETFEVTGKGTFTLRQQGQSRVFGTGQHDLSSLRGPGVDCKDSPLNKTPELSGPHLGGPSTQGLITDLVRPLENDFHTSLATGQGLGAAQALLEIDALLERWSGDSDVYHRQLARATFRHLIAELGQASVAGLQDPKVLMGPLVESLLAFRDAARRDRRYDVADLVRQSLESGGVEIQDRPEGCHWGLAVDRAPTAV